MRRYILILIILASIGYNAYSKPIYVRPNWILKYTGDIKLTVYTLKPTSYPIDPKICLEVEVELNNSRNTYKGCYLLKTGHRISGNLPWSVFPLIIPRYLDLNSSIEFDDGEWRSTGFEYIIFKGYGIKTIVFSRGKLYRLYDWNTGLLIKGYISFSGKYYLIELNDTNLEWIYIRYRNFYVDYRNLTIYLMEMNRSYTYVYLHSIGKSVLGNDIWALEIGPRSGRAIVVSSCIHGPEMLGIKVSIYAINRIVSNKTIIDSLKNRNIKLVFIMPLNPDGLEFSKLAPPEREYRGYVRKNARYVDLNRNFNFSWNTQRASADVNAWNYKGPSPLSEPEAVAFSSYIAGEDVIMHIDLHTGEYGVVIPPAYGGKVDKLAEYIGKKIAEMMNLPYYRGSIISAAYLQTYMIYQKGLTLAFIIELHTSDSPRWFERYNVISQSKLNDISEKFYKMIAYFADEFDWNNIKIPEEEPSYSRLAIVTLIAIILAAMIVAIYRMAKQGYRV